MKTRRRAAYRRQPPRPRVVAPEQWRQQAIVRADVPPVRDPRDQRLAAAPDTRVDDRHDNAAPWQPGRQCVQQETRLPRPETRRVVHQVNDRGRRDAAGYHPV